MIEKKIGCTGMCEKRALEATSMWSAVNTEVKNPLLRVKLFQRVIEGMMADIEFHQEQDPYFTLGGKQLTENLPLAV